MGFGQIPPIAHNRAQQVIAWKDSSPKWPIMCSVGYKPLFTQSVEIELVCSVESPFF